MARILDGPTPKVLRTVSLMPASEIAVTAVRWLWQDRVALGTLCLVGGREGVGKSLATYTIAAQVTKGELPGVYFGIPKSVVISASEDSWSHTIVPRLLGAGADLDYVYRIDVFESDGAEGQLTLPVDLVELQRAVKDVDAGLIVLDPILSRIDAALDTHKDAEVRKALEPIVKVAELTKASVIGLIHVNKSISSDPLTMLMGSRAFAAVARSVLFVMADPDDSKKRLLGQAKNNLGRMDLPTLSFQIVPSLIQTSEDGEEIWTGRVDMLGEVDRSIQDAITASCATAEEHTARDEATDWLSDYLSDGGKDSAKVKQAAKAAAHSERTLQRARLKLRVITGSVGFPRRTIWTLPSGTTGTTDVYEG